jgi:hypothetical protein
VDFPTRTTKDSGTAIDNIFIDFSRLNSFQIFPFINGLSDHEAQYLYINNIFKCQSGINRLVKKRLITKSGVSSFIELLKSESWNNILNQNDVNQSFNLFFNTFLIAFDSCFPIQYVTRNITNNQWITTGIKTSCKHKMFLYIMSKITNCSKIKAHYNQYCNLLRKVVTKAKAVYYNELLTSSTNKTRATWNIINKEMGLTPSKKIIQTEFKLGNETINVNQAAKTFNNYFINSVDELITQQPKTELAVFSLRESFPCKFPQIINIPITEAEVICTITSLKTKNSCGYDGLSNKILKLCGSHISKPLTYICNKSLSCGICPECLKYAIIIPCFKKGEKSQITNYRPISLLTGFSKIFEFLIFQRLKDH